MYLLKLEKVDILLKIFLFKLGRKASRVVKMKLIVSMISVLWYFEKQPCFYQTYSLEPTGGPW